MKNLLLAAAIGMIGAQVHAASFTLQCIQTLPNGGAYANVNAVVTPDASGNSGNADITLIQGGVTIVSLKGYPVTINQWAKGTEIYDKNAADDNSGSIKLGISSFGTIGEVFIKNSTGAKVFTDNEQDCSLQ